MLRLIHIGNNLPYSLPLEESAEFEPGMVGQLVVFGNQVCATVSNGLAPFGLIDDQRTKAFSSTSWDESLCAPVSSNNITLNSQNQLCTLYDIKMELNNPNVRPASFVSIPVPVILIPRNGVVIFPAGTLLNYDLLGTGIVNAIKTNVRYAYAIPNILGDDTTIGSRRITIWFGRMIVEITGVFETNQVYPLNCNLFVSELGLITSRQPALNYPSIGICTAPPTAVHNSLQMLWL